MKKQDDVVNLVNISTQKWPPRMRTYLGALTIASPEGEQQYAITPVRGCKGAIDMGDKHTMEYTITAREIAEDLAREINGDSGREVSTACLWRPARSPPKTNCRRRGESWTRFTGG